MTEFGVVGRSRSRNPTWVGKQRRPRCSQRRKPTQVKTAQTTTIPPAPDLPRTTNLTASNMDSGVLARVETTRSRHSTTRPSPRGENSLLQLPRSNQTSPLDGGVGRTPQSSGDFLLLQLRQSGAAAEPDRPDREDPPPATFPSLNGIRNTPASPRAPFPCCSREWPSLNDFCNTSAIKEVIYQPRLET